jgi:3-deoxy-D-manno-octulosonate 8-phosphate phosphatase KdsC-like HAD superfamily phosphatase
VTKKTGEEKELPKKQTENQKHELTSSDLITGDSSTQKVRFRAHPLEIQEVFNGTSNSTSLGKSLNQRSPKC